MKARLLVADVLDGLAGALDDAVAGDALGSAIFAGDDDAVGGGEGFAGDPDGTRIGAGGERFGIEQVDDLVGDAVADLVGVTLGNRFARELIIPAHHQPQAPD